MTEDQIRELLREMRDDAIPPDSRVRLRAGVMERIRAGGSASVFHRWGRLVAVLLATASLAIVLLFLRPSGAVHKTTPPIAARRTEARLEKTPPLEKNAGPPLNVLRRTKGPRARTVQAALRRQKAQLASSGVLIRIETPDPDVLIVLVGES